MRNLPVSDKEKGMDSWVTWRPIIMQLAGRDQPVQRSYWPDNAIDWLG